MRRIEKMPTPQGIALGQVATCHLPIGPTYHRFNIRAQAMVGGTKTNIPSAEWGDYFGDIRLMINGNTRIVTSAGDLAKLNTYHGQMPTAGILTLFLSAPWARLPAGEDTLAYGTATGVADFSLEIDIKDNGSPIALLEIFAEQTEARPFGSHLSIQRFSKQMGLAGVLEIAELPRGPFNALAMHITSPSIDNVELLSNNVRFHNSDRVVRNSQLVTAKRTPQAGMTHLDFMLENRMSETLPMAVNDFRMKLEFTTAAPNFHIYTHTIQGLAG